VALHTHLPIYKVTYDLTVHASKITRSFPRDARSHAVTIRELCAAMVLLIYRANSAKDKRPHLSALLEQVQITELMLRLARDLALISVGQYADAVEMTDAIGKQAMGWRKSCSPSA